MARLVFLGTPPAAVPPLRALVDAGHQVALVVTRPDRRRSRGPATSPSPVKRAALELGLPVTDDLAAVGAAGADLGVVVAYGRIIPAALLDEVAMVNLHFSLLPRWRGAAPVERAILAGDEVTGVCVMGVEAGLDTGPVYASAQVAIGDGETAEQLRARLVEVGTGLLVAVLAGPLPTPVPQEGEATYAEKVTPAELELRWERPAAELVRVVRVGRAWTRFRGRRLGVLEAAVDPGPPPDPATPPGTLAGDAVATGAGFLRLVVVQPEGGRAMAAADWRRGARPSAGERL
jgi:methionyl-tRNA formyltransferase